MVIKIGQTTIKTDDHPQNIIPGERNGSGSVVEDESWLGDTIVGLFTSVAIILLIWAGFWWSNLSVSNSAQTIRVLFPGVAGLTTQAPVNLDGLRIGNVTELKWKANSEVLAVLRITESGVRVPTTAHFRILSNGVVGAKYVEIVMPKRIEPGTPEITSDMVMMGERPVRPELAVNKLALGLSKVDPEKLVENYREDRVRLIRAADQLYVLADKSMPVVEEALTLERELIPLTKDMNVLTDKAIKFVQDPEFSADLKETSRTLKETVEKAKEIVAKVETIVSDEEVRKDLLTAMDDLKATSKEINHTMDGLRKVTGNKALREDLKGILRSTRRTLEKANQLLDRPVIQEDLHKTLTNANSAVDNVDLAARQLNSMLDKRFPLFQMMFGRPGHVEKLDKKTKAIEEKTSKKKKDARHGEDKSDDPKAKASKKEDEPEIQTKETAPLPQMRQRIELPAPTSEFSSDNPLEPVTTPEDTSKSNSWLK